MSAGGPFRLVLVAAALNAGTGPVPAHAQDTAAGPTPPPAYRAQRDTLWYERSAPYRLYWLRGADSIGWAGDDASVEAHVWGPARGDSLLGSVVRHALGPDRTVSVDSVVVDRGGALLGFRGAAAGRYDLRDPLPPLPTGAGPVEPGRTWVDTMVAAWTDAAGDHAYSLTRRVEVWQVTDTLGARVARLRAEGTARLRTAIPLDDLGSARATLDVRGPVEETYRVDLTAGRLLSRAWNARLEGTGEIRVPGERTETLPAGMTASVTLSAIGPDRALALARPLVGADTTWAVSFEDGRETLHTSTITEDSIVGGQARAGGVVSTVELVDAGVGMGRLRWLRTAPGQPVREIRLGAPASAADGGAVAPPPPLEVAGLGYWVPGHEELLVPLAAALPIDSVGRRIAVWSVPDEAWVEGDALLLERGQVVLAVFTFDRPLPVLSLLIERGELLYVERGTEGERGPLPGTPQRDYVDELVRAFTADRPPPPPRDRRS
ncbi:MAG TPA: hypothetical protein VK837_10670 [Longimicrobiales bacterium]|nr:hypothetical protein [Longimicrobiales bacterium]